MKKLILLFLLGIFLLSFISATISIIPPPHQPENLTAENITGNLGADTYKFRVIHGGNMSTSRSGAQLWSPSSNEVTININSTQAVHLHWDNSTDPWVSHTWLFVKKDSEDIWRMILANGYSPYLNNDYNFTTWSGKISAYNPQIWMKDGNSPDPSVPNNISTTDGVGMISVSGDAGSLSFIYVILALQNYYGGDLPNTTYWDGKYYFTGAWSLDTHLATSGTMDLSAWKLWMYGGIENGANFQLKAGYNTNQPTVIEIPPYAGSSNYLHFGKASLNNTIIGTGAQGLDANYFSSLQLATTDDTKIWNSVVTATYPSLAYLETYKNSKLIMSQLLVNYAWGKEQPFEDLNVLQGIVRIAYSYTNDTYFRRLVHQQICTASYHIEMRFPYASSVYSTYLVDSEFPQCSDLPIVYWRPSVASKPLYIGYSFNLKTVYENGTSIPSANVTLIDKNGDTTFTKLTDSNGEIEEQFVFPRAMNRSTLTVGYTDQVIGYAPYNLSIITTNFADYELNNLNFTEKVDWTIALSETSGTGGGEIVIYSPGQKIIKDKYPYLNYEISSETDTSNGIVTKPYITKTST